jgi:preprotein translocase subunit SecA
MIRGTVTDTVMTYTSAENASDWDFAGLRASFMGYLTAESDFRYSEDQLKKLKQEDILDMLCERAMARLQEKEQLFGADTFKEVQRAILLRHVDSAWMDHIDAMDDLKSNIGLQAYAHRDPVVEYRMAGADMFDAMVADIRAVVV